MADGLTDAGLRQEHATGLEPVAPSLRGADVRTSNSAVSQKPPPPAPPALPGRFPLTDKRAAPAGQVYFSSIRGFKGLESSVVVLCELQDADDETLGQQLYVGLSRATTHCVVVAPG